MTVGGRGRPERGWDRTEPRRRRRECRDPHPLGYRAYTGCTHTSTSTPTAGPRRPAPRRGYHVTTWHGPGCPPGAPAILDSGGVTRQGRSSHSHPYGTSVPPSQAGPPGVPPLESQTPCFSREGVVRPAPHASPQGTPRGPPTRPGDSCKCPGLRRGPLLGT